jgi:N-acetylglucosamine kinase-like BadF-type ATPase
MSFFLALDAGGTGTECAVADDEQILARARGGSIKILRVPEEEARKTLRALAADAADRANIRLDQITAACAGVSGFRVPAVGNWLRAALGELVKGPVVVCGDEEIALDAAFPGESGVVIIAGTGSNAVARTSTGRRVNVGGWGPALGDEGSAYWIGQQALRASLRAWDRGEPGLLLQRVAEHWQAADIWQIVEKAHGLPPPDFAALAPLVNACAEQGDRICREVLAAAGQELAEAGALAFAKVWALERDYSPAPGVAFAGSVLRGSSIVREQMIESLRRALPTVHILPEAVDPILGALWVLRGRRDAASPQGC